MESNNSPLQWQIGNVKITAIIETALNFPFQTGFEDKFDTEVLSENGNWLVPNFDNGDGTFTMAFQAFILESKGKKIMVDTCIGESPIPMDIPIDGKKFILKLREAGYEINDIDYVLCTHLHFDHVGWNTIKVNDKIIPTFPKARYLFGRIEYEFWKDNSENEFVSNFNYSIEPLFEANKVDLIEVDHVITDEVKLIPTFGHSPGHVSVIINSKGKEAMITGDCTHHPIQWIKTDWAFFTDYNRQLSTKTREKLLPNLVDTEKLIIGTHYSYPIAGYLKTINGKIVFEAK